jgi:hypothetical protein
VIGLARERFAKNLRSERRGGTKPGLVSVLDDAAQVGCVVAALLENREAGVPLREQAVLFRTAHHSALLEIELVRRNIPFVKYGGLRFVETAHVKDVLAILRWAENPADRVAGFRVLQLLQGVGAATAGRALDAVSGAGGPRLSPPSARLRRPPPGGASSSSFSGACRDAPANGPRPSTSRAGGISLASRSVGTMPPCAPPTSTSWAALRWDIPRARGSWPRRRWIRRRPPAARRAARIWTRTI